jgi:hypothetical protein
VEGSRLWREILAEIDITDAPRLTILEQGCASYDRAESLRRETMVNGELIETHTGGIKANPLLMVDITARALVARLLDGLRRSNEPKRGPGSHQQESRMVERRQLTDEHIALWSQGCALLQAMSPREYDRGESKRYREFKAVDKKLAWRLVGSHSCSLLSVALDSPPRAYLTPSHLQYIDWSTAQTWRKALIEATGVSARVPSP